jgi:hypothetical protein
MHRTFADIGVTIDGIRYGHFTGQAQFDREGSVEHLALERGDGRSPLSLEIDRLIIERSRLRENLGSAALTSFAPEIQSHRRRLELFQALAESLEAMFAEDIRQHVAKSCRQSSGRTAA